MPSQGGLIQLVAKGAQDVYLTGNPDVTFFKVVYRRHTNFSRESIQQSIVGTPSPGSTVSCEIGRFGDLISGMYLEFETELQDTSSTADHTMGPRGDVLNTYFYRQAIEFVELEIGGQKIDKHYGRWLDMWYTLSQSGSDKSKNALIGTSHGRPHYVPLMFWFNRNPGLSLPLISLQYHEVKVNIKFGTGSSTQAWSQPHNAEGSGNNTRLLYKGMSKISTAKLWVDYIFLETEERKAFAKLSHEYLIEQVQYTGGFSVPQNTTSGFQFGARLDFNHPVKELVWVLEDSDGYPTYEHDDITITFNGTERFAKRSSEFFTVIQPYYHHTCNVSPSVQLGIHVYSFALRPEQHQPSGAANFSRIDNVTLQIGKVNKNLASNNPPVTGAGVDSETVGWWQNNGKGDWVDGAGSLHIFAFSYNVLRVVSGMGALAYNT